MAKFFNTAGPCRAELHYLLSPTTRVRDIRALAEGENYFVLHAPRQVGKTTSLLALAAELTASGRYASALVSCELGQAARGDVATGEPAVLAGWYFNLENHLPPHLQPPPREPAEPGTRIMTMLSKWAKMCPLPIVLFIDEIDALSDELLITVLRQLRTGYTNRPGAFPQSIALIGMRDVRDYKVSSGGSERLNTSSPFNIKSDSLLLRNFLPDEIPELLLQHTEATGQRFDPTALEHVFYLTQGQPWLVNALARQLVEKIVPDRTQVITQHHVELAKELLIQRRDTHIDSLAERLQESRIRAIIEPMLLGETLPNLPGEDRRYVLDMGLVREVQGKALVIANPIYAEIIPREAMLNAQSSILFETVTWLDKDGKLDPELLLETFLCFWAENGEILGTVPWYPEAAYHLVLMAFLQRIVNGGGHVEREYALGRKRLDLLVVHQDVRLAIEVKRIVSRQPDPKPKGLLQLEVYLARLNLDFGWLVLFDARPNDTPLYERIFVERLTLPSGRKAVVITA